jgi:hypothetical protein
VTYARFRISSAGGLGPLGLALDGEVEDYQVLILLPPGQFLVESFDVVTAPALPAGWTTVSTGDALWRTDSTNADTPPNAAYVPNPSTVSLNRLSSPVITITPGFEQLRFRNWYNMEEGYDGGVLEISINGGPRQDILSAGGQFLSGGYNFTLPAGWSNPLVGRAAWSGDSNGFIETIVQLPPAAIGQDVQFHWIEGTDSIVASVGWWIDTIVLWGEETDYSFDFGDAPDPSYPTLFASGGAAHVVGGGLFLGSGVEY